VPLTVVSGWFQWAPTLGGECYIGIEHLDHVVIGDGVFQWAPTLGGECYTAAPCDTGCRCTQFQWAPTLGGECYLDVLGFLMGTQAVLGFNGHPPLGVNATDRRVGAGQDARVGRFNGHPPLGVNATSGLCDLCGGSGEEVFQWAPTLRGECYGRTFVGCRTGCLSFNGHPPLGVNATRWRKSRSLSVTQAVFNGHPPLGVNATKNP